MTQRACGAAGFVPRPVAVAGDFAVVTALAARRAGVTLVPRLALPPSVPGISVHPLARPVHRSIHASTAQAPQTARKSASYSMD